MENKIFVLEEKIDESLDVVTLKFSPVEDKSLFSYRAGQFVVVKFLEKEDFKGIRRAYTITSLPENNFLGITVKRLGKFSNALCDFKISEKVEISGPYGNFYPVENENNIVFLAGGIGIVPFYAILKDFLKKKRKDKKITLFYSSRTKNDIIFLSDLNKFSEEWKNLNIIYSLTREKENHGFVKEFKRINIGMIKKYLDRLEDKVYFICGPSELVNNLQNSLKNAGVKSDLIKTEAFY